LHTIFPYFFFSHFLIKGAQDGELELTGGEDSIVLNAVIATLPPVVAYREGKVYGYFCHGRLNFRFLD